MNARSYKSVFLHLSITNECRIVRQAESVLSLSLTYTHTFFPCTSYIYSFSPLYSSQADEETTERKSKSYSSSNAYGGYFLSQFEKRNRMIRFSSTFFFSSAYIQTYIYIYIHTYNIRKFFFTQQKNTRLNTLI